MKKQILNIDEALKKNEPTFKEAQKKAEKTKTSKITVYFNESEYDFIKEESKKRFLTMSNYVRLLISKEIAKGEQ